MANRYFADLQNGETIEFTSVDNRNQSSRHTDTWGRTGGEWVKVTRVIAYKSNPLRHECDSRCMNAAGRTMQCECSCGGKNHGRGAFNCETLAA